MFLDLWSLVILTGDLLDLVEQHLESVTFSVSLSFVVFTAALAVISIFAWRSTNIPDLPPAPRPPYVIQISGTPTPVNNNGERNPLGDVRLLSSSTTNVESVLRRFPATVQARAARGQPNSTNTYRHHRVNIATSGGNLNTRTTVRVYPQIQTSHQHGHPAQSNVVLGIVPPHPLQYINRQGALPVRPNSSQGPQAQNVIVYHRVNVYHHHLHHPAQATNAASTDSSSSQPHIANDLGSASTTGSVSVDSSTQYESTDALPQTNATSIPNEVYSDNQVDPTLDVEVTSTDVNPETGEEIVLESEESTPTHEQLSVPEYSGLRRRNLEPQVSTTSDGRIHNQNPTIQAGEDLSCGDSSDTSSRAMTDVNQRHVGSDKTDGAHKGPASSSSEQARTENEIRFTIKFLNDTQLDVSTQPTEKIGDFKQRHFAAELSENKTVRLIFNGRVLDNDSSTLRESGIFDQCVVHCLIVSRQPAVGGETSSSGPTGTSGQPSARQIHGFMRAPEPGMFFVAFIGVFLLFLWFICFHFGQHLFTQSAVASLTVLTAIFLIGLVAFYLPVHPN